LAWLLVIVVEIDVACASLALTAAWISALQSMVEVLLVPLVVTELEEFEVVVGVEVALETVMNA
jgi:hypothetical protein